MAQLVVRNLEDDVKAKLQRRARRHGRSTEEEVRDILRDAVSKRAPSVSVLDRGSLRALPELVSTRTSRNSVASLQSQPTSARDHPRHERPFRAYAARSRCT